MRVVLSMRPEEKTQLLRLACGRQISAYVLDCVIFREEHRPRARVERPIATLFTVERVEQGAGSLMQVRTDTYADGRTVDTYTGIQYPDDATALEDCRHLNTQTPRRDPPRATPAPGGALTPQDGG